MSVSLTLKYGVHTRNELTIKNTFFVNIHTSKAILFHSLTHTPLYNGNNAIGWWSLERSGASTSLCAELGALWRRGQSFGVLPIPRGLRVAVEGGCGGSALMWCRLGEGGGGVTVGRGSLHLASILVSDTDKGEEARRVCRL